MFESLCDYQIDDFEYCIIADGEVIEDSISVIVPKITPLMVTSEKKEFNISFNPNIFVNNSETKPRVDRTVEMKNYLNIKMYNDTLSRKYMAGESAICHMINKDITDIYLTNIKGGVRNV